VGNIYLNVPTSEEMHYRRKWMLDPETMDYNAGYELDIAGYNKEDGTIRMNDEELKDWYYRWIDKEPNRYFAYIYDSDIEEPVGEIYYYLNEVIHSMGILIAAKYRGKGYSYKALSELQKVAFEKNGIDALVDFIPLSREKAIYNFKKAGFVETGMEEKVLCFDKEQIAKQLLITKDMFFYGFYS